MDTTDSARLLPSLLDAAGLQGEVAREPIRVWARSGVERLRLHGGGSVVFKYAEDPFDREHVALGVAADAAIPVPALLASHTEPGLLGMLLEDLGEPVRDADDHDGARAAARLHQADGGQQLPRLDGAKLIELPARIVERAGKLELPQPVAATAAALAASAQQRGQGAHLPPFGLCHSEFHPTSLHVSASGWRLLDLARAFTGPGLIDLASWHGTLDAPDPDRTAALIEAYVAAGGARTALAERGGLPAAVWALGWHRVWVADWFTEQIERGWAQGAQETWTNAIIRHLEEAAQLLNP